MTSERKSRAVVKHTAEEPEKIVPVEVPDVDDILDEIDSVLEENAEEFVRSYVQKGGE